MKNRLLAISMLLMLFAGVMPLSVSSGGGGGGGGAGSSLVVDDAINRINATLGVKSGSVITSVGTVTNIGTSGFSGLLTAIFIREDAHGLVPSDITGEWSPNGVSWSPMAAAVSPISAGWDVELTLGPSGGYSLAVSESSTTYVRLTAHKDVGTSSATVRQQTVAVFVYKDNDGSYSYSSGDTMYSQAPDDYPVKIDLAIVHTAELDPPPEFFYNIQDAIDAASGGETIYVYDGTYSESLKINKSLSIIGNPGDTIIINGTHGSWDTDLKSHHPARAPGTYVYTAMDYVVGTYNGANVNFTNLVIDGENNLPQPSGSNYVAGIAFYNAGGSFLGCEIKRTKTNPEVCDGAGISIYVDSGSYTLEIDDCEFNTWGKRALHAYGSGITLKVDDSTFTGNGGTGPAYGLQNGIVGCGGLDMEVTDSTFEEIRATDGTYESVGVMAGYGYRDYPQYHCPAHDLNVRNCTFYNTGDVYVRRSMGVWITTTGTAVVEDCTFTNTDGIVSEGTNNGTLYITSQDITISHCDFNGPSYPASVDYWTCGVIIQRGGKADIEYCTFNGFHDNDTSDGDGIAFYSWHDYSGSTGGTVKYCTFTDCVEGIYSGTTVTPLAINYNNFDGTNDYGIWNNDPAANIDGRFNWWGHASGPYHNDTNLMAFGDAVTDNVTYSPWLGFVAGTTPMTYHVNPTGKIQDAIDDACPGDTILVHDGNYSEALYINKTLTIKAASKPIVKGSQSVTTNYGDRDAVIFVENAASVTIEGLDIEGEGLGTTNPKSYGVIYEESSGTIKDCIVSPNTIGDMNGVAIGAWDGSDLTVDPCTIENFGRIGVFYFNGCSGGVYDSTIIGQVYSDEGEVNYGIEVEGLYGACDIEIIGNDIYNSDNTHPSPLWSSAGIVIDGWMAFYSPPTMQSSTVVIEGNDIHANYYGIEVVANSLSYAHCNKIHDNREYGVISDADSFDSYVTFDAEWNWWGNETGPYHPTTNPDGTGDRVSDYVDYEPWKVYPIMKVEPEVAAGQIFEVNVTINDLIKEWKVVGVQFKLHFNSTILQVLNVTEGPFLKQFKQPGAPQATFFMYFIEDGDTLVGIILLANATGLWPGPFPEGSGTLATITFNGTGRIIGKTCQMNLTTNLHLHWTKLIDPEDNRIPHYTQDGDYIYTTLLGDVNFDDIVDVSDLAALARAYGEVPGRPRWNPDYDINCDEIIDISDLALAARNFGSTW